MRLSLLVPFNMSNYVFGASAVKVFDFIIGTFGLVPLVLFFVYIGTTMSNIEEVVSGTHEMSTSEIVIMVVGSCIAFSGLIFATVVVKRTLKNELEKLK